MHKFTPGPWTFSTDNQFGDTRFYIAQQEGAPYTPHYSDVATVIAETCVGDRLAIQEANARLIAAAPELLESLQAAMACGMVPISSAKEGGAAKFSEQVRVADRIRAAIAKATGSA